MVVLFRAGGAALLVREMLQPAPIGCIFTAAHAYVNKTRVDLLPFNVLGPKLKALGHLGDLDKHNHGENSKYQ